MASGRMEFHAESIMQHANFAFVLPNDVYEPEIKDKRHYARPPKTLILLHGLTGTDTDWLFGGVAQEMAVQYNLAVFMPTAGNNFYLDRGYPGGNWGSFVGEELPAFIRRTFGFCQSREDTLIGGLSMGGFGALHTAMRYPETFSGCAALSSALVLHEVAELGRRENSVMPEAMVRDVFGDPKRLLGSEKDPEFLYKSAKAAGKALPEIYMAVGTEDSLLHVNRDGQHDRTWNLQGDKVALTPDRTYYDPQAGTLTLYGSAAARNTLAVFAMTLDDDMNMIALDVRNIDPDYIGCEAKTYLTPDGFPYVYLFDRDHTDRIRPAVIPFSLAGQSRDDYGITIRRCGDE